VEEHPITAMHYESTKDKGQPLYKRQSPYKGQLSTAMTTNQFHISKICCNMRARENFSQCENISFYTIHESKHKLTKTLDQTNKKNIKFYQIKT
jgi:hypothetical protein